MENKEAKPASIDGKKVFFLRPKQNLQNLIIERLRTMEYEVYVIDDYKILKSILRKNRNSICFINPQGLLTAKGWLNFMKSIEESPRFGGVKLGILTEPMKASYETDFKNALKLEAGWFSTLDDSEEILRNVVRSIDKLEAKGMRHYVRASCDSDKTSEVFWLSGNMMYKMKIRDISAVGMAVKIPQSYLGVIRANQTLLNAQVMLNSRRMTVHLFVLAVKEKDGQCIAVLMFGRETDKNVLVHIREYVAKMLHTKLMDSVYGESLDTADYNSLS